MPFGHDGNGQLSMWQLQSGRNLKVAQRAGREDHTERIQDGKEVDQLLRDGSLNWADKADRCCSHTDQAQAHASNGTCESNPSHPSTYMNQLIDTRQGGLKDYSTRRLGGNVTIHTKGNTRGRRHHCWSVIDAVAKVQGVRLTSFLTHELQLFFGTFATVRSSNSHTCRK